ncbi:MAG TPA: hypothetical protein VFZ97_09560 [Acidimicrobiales bacterium]
MGWALTLEGRVDPAAIVLLVDDKEEAESIAQEVRRNGTRIVLRPYPNGEMASRLGLSNGGVPVGQVSG